MAEGSGTGTPSTSTEVYATLAELKARLGISGSGDDDLLNDLLEGASRAIDDWCHRVFYQTSAGTRYFDTQDDSDELLIDDCLSVTSLATDSEGDGSFDGESWTEGVANDFYLWPLNRSPKMKVVVGVAGSYSFPKCVRNYVKIVGDWGYASEVPIRIKMACLALASEGYHDRAGKPFESEQLGDYRYKLKVSIERDRGMMRMLGPYRRCIA